jgi:hypothetical protein
MTRDAQSRCYYPERAFSPRYVQSTDRGLMQARGCLARLEVERRAPARPGCPRVTCREACNNGATRDVSTILLTPIDSVVSMCNLNCSDLISPSYVSGLNLQVRDSRHTKRLIVGCYLYQPTLPTHVRRYTSLPCLALCRLYISQSIPSQVMIT